MIKYVSQVKDDRHCFLNLLFYRYIFFERFPHLPWHDNPILLNNNDILKIYISLNELNDKYFLSEQQSRKTKSFRDAGTWIPLPKVTSSHYWCLDLSKYQSRLQFLHYVGPVLARPSFLGAVHDNSCGCYFRHEYQSDGQKLAE